MSDRHRRTERQIERADRFADSLVDRIPKLSRERAYQVYDALMGLRPDEAFAAFVAANPDLPPLLPGWEALLDRVCPPRLRHRSLFRCLLLRLAGTNLELELALYRGEEVLVDGIPLQAIAAQAVEVIDEEVLLWSNELDEAGFDPPGADDRKWGEIVCAVGKRVADCNLTYGMFADATDSLLAMADVGASNSGNDIPPSRRTRPLSYRKAAKLLGLPGSPKKAAESLAAAVREKTYRCVHHSRQMHFFDIRDFPKDVHDLVRAKRP